MVHYHDVKILKFLTKNHEKSTFDFITINNKIICPLCRYSNILEEQNINDLPINSTLISLIDSKNFQNNNIKKYKKPLKKSKSVDCLIYPKKFNW